MLHLQKVVGGPLNVFADLVSVGRPIEKGPQDEHVKSAQEEARAGLCPVSHRRRSTLDLAAMVDRRLSLVKKFDDGGILRSIR